MKTVFILCQFILLITTIFASSSSSSSDEVPTTTTTTSSTSTSTSTTTTTSTSIASAESSEEASSEEASSSEETTQPLATISPATATTGCSDDSSSSSGSSSGSSSNPCNNNNDDATSEPAAGTTSQPGPTISTEALCGCFELDIVCEPTITDDKTCYFYQLNRISDESYCTQINYLILGTGDECELPSETIDELIVNYAPKCYDIEIDDGIKIIFDENDSTSSGSGSSSNSGSGDGDSSGSSSSGSSSGGSGANTIIISDDFMVFSICFDSDIVAGTQTNGQIEVSLGSASVGSSGGSSSSDSSSDSVSSGGSSGGSSSSSGTSDTNNVSSEPQPETTGVTWGEGDGENVFICDVFDILPNFCITTTTQAVTTTTISTEFSICESNDALNVAFLLDESESVNKTEWGIMNEFVARIINMDVSPMSYVALWEYARIIAPNGFSQFLDFTNANDGRNALPNTFEYALNNNSYNKNGLTDTWEAVNRVLDSFWDYRFECTDGCDTRADILFVITDGAPTDNPCPQIVPRLNQSDVDIVLIIVGGGGNGHVDWYNEVSCLDVGSNYTDIHLVPEFDSDDFNAIEGRIREKLCSGDNPPGESKRPENGTQWRYNGSIGLGPIPTSDGNCAPNCGGNDAAIIKMGKDNSGDHNTDEIMGMNAKQGFPLLVGVICVVIILIGVGIVYGFSKCPHNQKRKMEMQIANANAHKHMDLVNVSTPTSPPEIEIQTGGQLYID